MFRKRENTFFYVAGLGRLLYIHAKPVWSERKNELMRNLEPDGWLPKCTCLTSSVRESAWRIYIHNKYVCVTDTAGLEGLGSLRLSIPVCVQPETERVGSESVSCCGWKRKNSVHFN